LTHLDIDRVVSSVHLRLDTIVTSYSNMGTTTKEHARLKDALSLKKEAIATAFKDAFRAMYSEDDMAAIAMFLSTPAGKKFSATYPSIIEGVEDKIMHDAFSVLTKATEEHKP
jgi:hypothetical protein